MHLSRRALLGTLGWTGLVSGLHGYLNVNWSSFLNDYLPEEKRKFNVAYIPVTCHLACPVTDYISKFSEAGEVFLPRMFQGFPEIKEALIANKMQAAFIVAPLAIALKAQGVPIKIVYLGHRYGSAVVVHKDGPVRTVPDLRGKVVAIPSRFSDERLILFRAMKVFGIKPGEIKMVEMAPPDVAGALAANAIDAFSMGEPFPSQAEMDGFGRVLFHAREYWPDYMSCVLAVRQDMIDRRPDAVQLLVDGVARSGLWLEEGRRNRENAADFVGRFYYNQNPALLRWALTKPLTRVMYSPLAPRKADFDMVRDLMIETGVLDRKIEFEEYTDIRFADRASIQTAWKYEPGSESAR
jgi:NitT/TauT family transport system substrate-binding protein